jgi:shikimate kinase
MIELAHIVITGFMASGKTSVGIALGRLLNWPMIDLDEVVSHRGERSIREIIEQDGADYFRTLETIALLEVLRDEGPNVVALGGGAWGHKRNRSLIVLRGCTTVWLDAPFGLCWQRIVGADEDERPLARDYDQALKLYEERRLSYQLAMIRIVADKHRSAAELATEISERCHEAELTPRATHVELSI